MTYMYVPTFQGLGAHDLLAASATSSWFPFTASQQQRCYRARNAIYHLFRALLGSRGRLTVLVPDYHSGNEILALRAAGVTIRSYPIGPGAQADVELLARLTVRENADALYVIHYLGWPQPIEALADLCRRREMLLIEDCALALLSEHAGRPLGSFGDFAVFCLYKTLPVPNGAVLVQNGAAMAALDRLRWRGASVASTAGRTAELFVQRLRSRADGIGHVLQTAKRLVGRASGKMGIGRAPVGDIGFDLQHVDLAMSGLSAHLIRRIDLAAVRQRRAANFRELSARLDGRVSLLTRAVDGVCPLFCPLLVADKSRAADELQRHGIQAIQFWNAGDPAAGIEEGPTARALRRHVLGLPVHQDVTPRQIAHMADHVARLNLRVAS